jgi:hypothetical protein
MMFLNTLGLAALAIGLSVAPSIGAAEPPTTFLCTNLASGASWQISVDFARHAVDSNPARISRAEISWHDRKDGGNYTLDRKSGKLTVVFASTTGGYFLYHRCRLEH